MVSLFWGDRRLMTRFFLTPGKSKDHNLSLHINLYRIAGIPPSINHWCWSCMFCFITNFLMTQTFIQSIKVQAYKLIYLTPHIRCTRECLHNAFSCFFCEGFLWLRELATRTGSITWLKMVTLILLVHKDFQYVPYEKALTTVLWFW